MHFGNRKLPGKSFEGWTEGMVTKICDNIFQKSKNEVQAGTYGQWGALLAGGEVIYPTGYGTLITAVILKSLCLIVVVVSVVADKEVI